MSDHVSLLFVNGTLMRGLALHSNLDGAGFVGEERTAPAYRLFYIADAHPGMFRDDADGRSIAGELYDLPQTSSSAWSRGNLPDSTSARSRWRMGAWCLGSSFLRTAPMATW